MRQKSRRGEKEKRRNYIRLCVFFCVLFALGVETSFAQSDPLVERFQTVFAQGGTEQKRTALAEIRNLKSETYSRAALPALRDADEIVRATAAFSVIYVPKDEALTALTPNLQDKSEIVRRETAYALGKIQNPNAINLLIQTFQNRREKSVEVKNAAIIALGEIGDAAAVDFLTGILRRKPTDENEFERRSAARSIGQIAQIIQINKARVVTPENFLPEKYKFIALEKYENLAAENSQFRAAVPVLTGVLQNARESDDAKREAAFALGAIGDAAALPALQSNLNSKDYYLAEICQEAVKKLSSTATSNSRSTSR